MEVGMKITVPPIPHIPENTRMFDAGAVRFGVEYRLLNDAIVGEHMGERPSEASRSEMEDSGVSIHVFGMDAHEYLRFDCFDADPHYHYIYPNADHQRWVPFDRAANGDPLTWAMACLRQRLEPMLRAAGGGAVADAVDRDRVRSALDDVERLARTATLTPA